MEYMILPFRRYLDFQGRSRRMEYWMFALLNIVIVTVLYMVAFGPSGFAELVDPAAGDTMIIQTLFGGYGILLLAWGLIVLIPSVAVTIRRLHDRDMSGWWYLGAVVGGMIPYVGFLFSLAFLVVMLLPGTHGGNRFGEDPKDPASAEVFE